MEEDGHGIGSLNLSSSSFIDEMCVAVMGLGFRVMKWN